MARFLKIDLPDRCNGCELCVMEVQRQLGKAGLEGSLIRIFRDKNTFSINIDPQISSLDLEKIEKVCPQSVFSTQEGDDKNELLG